MHEPVTMFDWASSIAAAVHNLPRARQKALLQRHDDALYALLLLQSGWIRPGGFTFKGLQLLAKLAKAVGVNDDVAIFTKGVKT